MYSKPMKDLHMVEQLVMSRHLRRRYMLCTSGSFVDYLTKWNNTAILSVQNQFHELEFELFNKYHVGWSYDLYSIYYRMKLQGRYLNGREFYVL